MDLALRWLHFIGSSRLRTNNFIIRQLFESCMKNGMYESAKPLLETYVDFATKGRSHTLHVNSSPSRKMLGGAKREAFDVNP